MPQTFYIENDEEIISVISRLRRSSDEENYFVFPKRALVLQSIVNLRLLQREAEKISKKIIIVTQDETGETLAKRAGLQSERYSDDFSRQASHLELTPTPPPSEKKIVASMIKPEQNHLRSNDVGSADYYAAALPQTPPATQPAIQNLRVRNASPEKQTSLNSLRSETVPTSADVSSLLFHASVNMPAPPVAPLPAAAPFLVPRANGPAEDRQVLQDGREKRLKNFFASGGIAQSQNNSFSPKSTSRPSGVPVASRKVSTIFFLLGGVSLLSLAGAVFFLFFSRAEVQVTPYQITQEVDLKFDGRVDVSTGEGSQISVRLAEKEENVTVSANATGAALGTAQKARGAVTLSNRYSSDAQPLVATTRIAAPDGKIYRLVEGVTVPGMNGSEPGVVEAAVIADQTGAEYNIGNTSFTIPGFKGSPKYNKFSAQSTKAITGGGSGNSNDLTVITKEDVENAYSAAKNKAREAYLATVESELLPGERVLKESLDLVANPGATPPIVGTAATSFDYQSTYKVRGFVFSEEALKQKILSQGSQTVGGVPFQPVSAVLNYGEAIPDFDGRTVRLKTHASVTSDSVIDRDKLHDEILGKDENGINALLKSYPEIKKIKVVFRPQWFSSVVPSSPGRVTVLVEPGEE